MKQIVHLSFQIWLDSLWRQSFADKWRKPRFWVWVKFIQRDERTGMYELFIDLGPLGIVFGWGRHGRARDYVPRPETRPQRA